MRLRTAYIKMTNPMLLSIYLYICITADISTQQLENFEKSANIKIQ
jgi:hypothetical protein